MNEQLLERPVTDNRPTTAFANNRNNRFTRPTPPAPFRGQERFWKEVTERITERNPAVREFLERLY